MTIIELERELLHLGISNDIVQAKIPRGYDQIEKKSDNILTAHYELGIIFEIDVNKREVVQKNYLR